MRGPACCLAHYVQRFNLSAPTSPLYTPRIARARFFDPNYSQFTPIVSATVGVLYIDHFSFHFSVNCYRATLVDLMDDY